MRQLNAAFLVTVGAIALLVLQYQKHLEPKSVAQPAGSDAFQNFKASPNSETWEVVKVSDGDTLKVRRGRQEEKIRLCGLDAPEKAQNLGQESKSNLQRLVEKANGKVQVVPIERDRYGRMVAEVFAVMADGSERFVQEEQLKAGLAFHYAKYSDSCPNQTAIINAEAIAKQNRAGVWGDPNSVPPWDFRRQQRG